MSAPRSFPSFGGTSVACSSVAGVRCWFLSPPCLWLAGFVRPLRFADASQVIRKPCAIPESTKTRAGQVLRLRVAIPSESNGQHNKRSNCASDRRSAIEECCGQRALLLWKPLRDGFARGRPVSGFTKSKQEAKSNEA